MGVNANYTNFDRIFDNTFLGLGGILMAGSIGFFIADNSLYNCNPYGIEVRESCPVASWPLASQIGYIAQGNIFTNCWVGVRTFLENDFLSIRCNIFDHPSQFVWSDFAWDVDLSISLGPQGSYSNTDTKAPAGNRFPIYGWGPSNVIRSYLPTPFAYYHHLDNYTTPVNWSGTPLGMIPYPDAPLYFPSNPDDACAPLCIPPNTNCFNSAIATYQSAIDDLQFQYDDLASKLDGEQTANLLNAIGSDTMSNASLGTLLVNNSPLSDEVLTYLLDSRDSLSSGQYTDIFIANSPVTKTMYPVISDLMQSLDEGDADTLKVLQAFNPNYITLTLLQRSIDQNELERQLLVNRLICYYLDSDSVGEAINLLAEQDYIGAKHALIGTYIIEGDYESADELLGSLPLITIDDTAYYDLYNIYIDLKSQDKMMWEMDSSQLARVYQIAEMCPVKVATGNARVLLYELFGETFDTCEINGGEERLAHTFSPKQNSSITDEIKYLGDCIPNPFNSVAYLPYFVPKGSKGRIDVIATSGKLIKSYSLKEGSNVLEINLANFNSGLYLCYMIIDDGAVVRQKKIVLCR